MHVYLHIYTYRHRYMFVYIFVYVYINIYVYRTSQIYFAFLLAKAVVLSNTYMCKFSCMVVCVQL